jgi:hypothetical protein
MIPISREDAFSHCENSVVLVKSRIGGFESFVPFDRNCPYYHASGPYDYAGLQYYLAAPETGRPGSAGGSGRASAKAKPGSGNEGEAGASEAAEADEPVSEEKPKPSITAKFLTESGYCGDAVQIQMTGENLPAKPAAKIDLNSGADGSLVESLSGAMDPLPYKAKWIARKKGAAWDKPEILIAAEAAGAKAKGQNKFKLKRLPDQAKETKTIACASGVFGWTGKFDIEFKDGVLVVVTKVKLINRLGAKPASGDPMPAAGDPVSAGDKADMKKDVESKLSGQWILHRKDCERKKACDCDGKNGCCKFQVRVQLDFVESGEHHVVNLFQGPGRANAANWTRVKTRDNSWAHETGHLLAWYDEYVGGAVGTSPRWTAPNDAAVMSSGLKVPFEYYWDFRDWLKGKTSQEWEGIA